MDRLVESELARVRAGFILKGQTLKSWCDAAGIDYGYAHKVVDGKTNGPRARALRNRILSAAVSEAA